MEGLESIYPIWGLTLLIALVVLLVVAFLLRRILSSVNQIEAVAGEIWTVGKLIANNTIHIPLLSTTNRVVTAIYDHALGIVNGSERIKEHAQGCPGCPHCVLEHSK